MKSTLFTLFLILSSCFSFAQTKAKSGSDMINYIITQLDKQIVIDKSSSKQIAALYKAPFDSSFIQIEQEFKGYYVAGGFSFLSDSLFSLSFDSFYDSLTSQELIKKDIDAIYLLLSKKYGMPNDSYDQTASWTIQHFKLDFASYDNGWGFYVSSLNRGFEYFEDYESGIDCEGVVGDFYGLTEDLSSVLLTNLKSGSLALGVTTDVEVATIFGDSVQYNKNFDGLVLSAYFTYAEGKLSSIRYDYFYDCENSRILLAQDIVDIKVKIDVVLGQVADAVGEGEYTVYNWDFGSYKITQSVFSDGYALTVFK